MKKALRLVSRSDLPAMQLDASSERARVYGFSGRDVISTR